MLKKWNWQELTAENSGKEKKHNEANGLESESSSTRNWQSSKTPVEDGWKNRGFVIMEGEKKQPVSHKKCGGILTKLPKSQVLFHPWVANISTTSTHFWPCSL